MATRTEFEKLVWLAGEEGRLFMSSGSADDYLELVFPDSVGPDSPALPGLEERARTHGLDVQIYPGRPVLVGITALYINAPERKAAPHAQRVEVILAQVAELIPCIDFGDLLPSRPGAVAMAAVEEAAPGAEPKKELPRPPQPIRRPDPLELRLRSARVAKARELAGAGQLKKAAALLEEILWESPADPAAASLLDAVRLLERREKRLRKEPGSLQASLEVGFSYLMLDRNQEAARMLDRTSRLGPNVYLPHLLHGIALHRLGQVAPARSAYLRAGRLRPRDRVHADLIAALERGEPPAGLMETGALAGRGVGQEPGPKRLVYAG